MFQRISKFLSYLLVTLRNSGKSLLVLVLAFNLAIPTRLYADQLDDYEKAVDTAVTDMWTRVRALVKLEREGMVEARVKRALEGYKAMIRLDVTEMQAEATAATTNLEEVSANIERISTEAAAFPKQTLSLANYDRLLQLQNNYKQYASQIPIDLNDQLEAMKKSIIIHQTSVANLCREEIPKLKREQFGLPPLASYVGKAEYTYINPVDFQRDPVAQAYALTAAAGSVIASILISIATVGVTKTFAGAALTYNSGDILFSATTKIGESSGGGGPLFWTIVIAIMVYTVVGIIKAEDNNHERKERAERAQKKLDTAVREASEWFERNRVSDEEYRSIANGICQKEMGANGSGILSGMTIELGEHISKIDIKKGNVETLVGKVKAFEAPLNGLVTAYREAMALQFKHDILAAHEVAMKDEAASTGGWNYYNANIKPMWNAFLAASINDKADEMEKCFFLSDRREGFRESLQFHKTILEGSFRDGASSQKTLGEIDKLVGTLKRQVDNYVKIECGDLLPDSAPSISLTF
jgi:uncharacterized membrane protein